MSVIIQRAVRSVSIIATCVFALSAPASAAIVQGSRIQINGIAFIGFNRTVFPVDEVSGSSPPPPVNVRIASAPASNWGSYAGYNVPNASGLPLAPSYAALMAAIPGSGDYGFVLLDLPAVSGETGPPVDATRFRLDTWAVSVDNGLFLGEGTGQILDLQDRFLADALFQLSAPGFQPGFFNVFSANLGVPGG